MAPQSGISWRCYHAVVLCFVLLVAAHHHGSDAWVPPASPTTHNKPFGHFSRGRILEHSPTDKKTTALAALPEGYQEFGERLIRQAGSQCGIQKDDDLTIEWKADRIVVTVHGQSYVSAEDKDDDDEDIVYDDDEEEVENEEIGADDDDDERGKEDEEEDYSLVDEMNSEDSADKEEEDVAAPSPMSPRGVDVTALARAINAALDDGGIGFAIAELHEIEVTTPGASDELKGPVMFEAYRGFEVICQQQDPKTKKVKQIEGRLVGRDKEFTTINIKGRIKKMKNSTILSVKLPKAKKEKGVS